MKKIILNPDKTQDVTNPLIAKEKAKTILNSNLDSWTINVGDYFLLKYLDLLGEGQVIFIYNNKKYKSIYDLFSSVEEELNAIDVLEDIYLLECMNALHVSSKTLDT